MPDVFISYKRERRPGAEHFAEIIRLYGFDVWFDYALVKGHDFAKQIDEKIRASKILVVLWCTKSVGSRWVHEEVDLAKDLQILLPVKIEKCELSIGDRRLDYFDLTEWDGSPRSHHLDNFLTEIGNRVGHLPLPNFAQLKEYEATWRRFGAPPFSEFALEAGIDVAEGRGGQLGEESPRDRSRDHGTLDIVVLHDIWTEMKGVENLSRLRRFLEQIRGTALEGVVEQRIENLERRQSDSNTAEWLKAARPMLSAIKALYQTMAWRQYGPYPNVKIFESNLRQLVSLLPPITKDIERSQIIGILEDGIETEIHQGHPIPDSYRFELIFPRSSSRFGHDNKTVEVCVRPGINVKCYSRRENFGDLTEGLLIDPELVFA
jgi:hypothetical protein